VTTAHTFDDELARWDGVATAEAVRRRQVSAEEVVGAAIERSRRMEPELGAVACEDYDRALARARTVVSGTFAGVPTFIKDMTDVAGLPTRNGSAAFADAAPAKATFPIAQQLFDMGAVGLGKSTLPEFGFTASTEFPDDDPTRNPWNTGRTAGGSSGGAAALVASGVVPIAHGQDGGGSIRIPAACGGLVGLKPSRGRLLPDPHERLLPVKLVVDGVLTRTVRDTAAYYLQAEVAHRSRRLPPLGEVTRPTNRRLRVGAFVETPTGAVVDAATRQTFDETVALLGELGHDVVPIDPPVDEAFAEDFIHFWSMLAYFTHSFGKVLFDKSFDPTKLTPLTEGLSARFRRKAANTPGAILRLRRAAAEYEELFGQLDVVLTPTLAHLPPELGHLGTDQHFDVLFPRVEQWVGFTPLANVTGAPAISLPLGFDDASNLPVAMMFSGAMGADGLLLQLALQLEAARPFPSLATG
jgi:amidase